MYSLALRFLMARRRAIKLALMPANVLCGLPAYESIIVSVSAQSPHHDILDAILHRPVPKQRRRLLEKLCGVSKHPPIMSALKFSTINRAVRGALKPAEIMVSQHQMSSLIEAVMLIFQRS